MKITIILATLVYCVSIVVFWYRVYRAPTPGSFSVQNHQSVSPLLLSHHSIILLVMATIFLHGWLVSDQLWRDGGLNLALGNVFSAVSLVTVLTFLVGSIGRDSLNLGLLVMPVGLAGVLTTTFPADDSSVLNDPHWVLIVHLALALIAFALLCIATAQALLLYLQENRLRNPSPGKLFPSLPAIQTMESNLFALTSVGFLLLTINLATGMWSLWQAEGKTLTFNHHILLSFLAWIGFGGLLVGHRFYGWRGKIAAKWTLAAFIVLLLAFFGTRFVTSIILNNG